MDRIALIMGLAVVVSSCGKPGSTGVAPSGDACSRYAVGHVIVGFRPVTTVEDVFALFNSAKLSVSQLSYFDYNAPNFSAADIPYLDSLLNTKPYILHGGWKASVSADYGTGAIVIRNMYWNMDAAAQADWLKTVSDLRLRQVIGQANQSDEVALALVPAGQEKFWLTALRNEVPVKWTELDCIVAINGYP